MDQSSYIQSGHSGLGKSSNSHHTTSHQGLPSFHASQPQNGAHSLIDFQGQLNNLKASILHPPTSEKHFMNALQWNIDGAQKYLDRIIEETEGKRLPAVKSMKPLLQLSTSANQNLIVPPSHAYKEWKQYAPDPKKKAKTKRDEPEKMASHEPSPLTGINPLSFTIKKVR